jgi:hypothetical protein
MSLNISDFEGTQPGSLRNLVIWRKASVRCSSSKCRKYLRTIVGIVMRSAVEKFCTAMACCFSWFVRKLIRQVAKSCALPGW